MRFLKNKICLGVLILITFCATQCVAESGSFPEHEVKSAFIFNFMRFTQWPEQKMGEAEQETDESEQAIKIFVIGNYKGCKTLKEMNKKKLHDRQINVHIFKSYKDITDPNTLKTCHVLFIDAAEKKNTQKILKIVKDNNVLTISEIPGFLEAGGMINFVKKDQKIRFEINRKVAEKEKLSIHSKLLKLAVRVVEEK